MAISYVMTSNFIETITLVNIFLFERKEHTNLTLNVLVDAGTIFKCHDNQKNSNFFLCVCANHFSLCNRYVASSFDLYYSLKSLLVSCKSFPTGSYLK